MTTIRFTKHATITKATGKEHIPAGTMMDLPEGSADRWIKRGVAERVVKAEAAPVEAVTDLPTVPEAPAPASKSVPAAPSKPKSKRSSLSAKH